MSGASPTSSLRSKQYSLTSASKITASSMSPISTPSTSPKATRRTERVGKKTPRKSRPPSPRLPQTRPRNHRPGSQRRRRHQRPNPHQLPLDPRPLPRHDARHGQSRRLAQRRRRGQTQSRQTNPLPTRTPLTDSDSFSAPLGSIEPRPNLSVTCRTSVVSGETWSLANGAARSLACCTPNQTCWCDQSVICLRVR